jgi:hypothetical protein
MKDRLVKDEGIIDERAWCRDLEERPVSSGVWRLAQAVKEAHQDSQPQHDEIEFRGEYGV